MKKAFFLIAILTVLTAYKPGNKGEPDKKNLQNDKYAFVASYSSDITVPGNPLNAQKVLHVWKLFEAKDVAGMKQYFADIVKYDDASGSHYNGPIDGLLDIAKKNLQNLDSLRFDISMWQSAHINDKNEDWVNIWARERRYSKDAPGDTSYIQENWQIKDGKVVAFNQYTQKK